MTKLKIATNDRINGGRTMEEVLAKIDFSDWEFPPDNEFMEAAEKFVRRIITEAFRNVLQDQPPEIEFQSDGASILVDINLGSNWNDGRIWFIASIEEMIDDLIERSHRDEMDGGDDAKIALADCLLRCAAKLKAAAALDEQVAQ